MNGASPWDRDVLAPCVHGNGVDYAALEREVDLAGLVTQVASADLSRESLEGHLAFFLNAYNLWVLMFVLQRLRSEPSWPGAVSLLDKLRLFLLSRCDVARRRMSLYGLENRVIRRSFDEPRIHFALNCASRSCPPLARRLFVADELDADLERLTTAFVNSQEVQYDPEENVLCVSAIFRWYRRDFEPSVPAFIARYRPVPMDAKLRFRPYDWRLNRCEP